MDLRKLLNKEQYDAATTVDGQVLILAGAGSGKTRVLTYRIAYMLDEKDINPYNILAITFTNKAAGEMKERVKKLIGERADSMWISTFHSTCVRILRREIDKIGYKKDFTIYDSSDQKVLVKQCMKELNINDKDMNEQEIISKISRSKDQLISPAQYKRLHEKDFRLNKVADVYTMYQKRLKENNALDFDDLISKAVEVFTKHPDVLEFYQKKFKYIMVDEYQDTNKVQYELVKLLAGKYKNICVVGDDDQCIYQWRGADIRNILDFEKDYPEAKTVKLEQNYRSKGNILDAANNVIKHNAERKDKVLRTEADHGEKIRIYRAYSDNDECDFVASKIQEIMKQKSLTYNDFTILYRTNAQSRSFEEKFIKRGIPYKIIGGTRFYDRKEIKDVLAYLKLINNNADSVSLRRIINVPKRSIGDATVEKVVSFANENGFMLYDCLLDIENVNTLTARNIKTIKVFTDLMEDFISMKEQLSASMLIEYVLEKTEYLKGLKESKDPEDVSRVENIKELVSAAVEFENGPEEDKSLSSFLEKVSLVQDVDNIDGEQNVVTLMTVHSAKGLEFPVVFMVGMENGIFPGQQAMNNEKEMEEARRLCYVGITRAKDILYMTSAEVRRVFGRTVAYAQSDFISEIPATLKEYESQSGGGLSTRNSIHGSSSYSSGNSYSGGGYSRERQYARNGIAGYGNSTNSMSYSEASKKLDSVLSGANEKKGQLTKDEAVPGRKIKHPKFGEGTIISAIDIGDDVKITIAFDSQGIKNLMLSFAPLELL